MEIEGAWIGDYGTASHQQMFCLVESADTFVPKADGPQLRMFSGDGHRSVTLSPHDLRRLLEEWEGMISEGDMTVNEKELLTRNTSWWSEYTKAKVTNRERAVVDQTGLDYSADYSGYWEPEGPVSIHFDAPSAIRQCLAVLDGQQGDRQ